jgi:spore germination protein GerM
MSGLTRILLALLLVLNGVLAGCSDTPATSIIASPTPSTTVDGQPVAPAGPIKVTPQEETMNVTVYSATNDAMQLVAQTHTVTKNDQPAQTAIELLLSGTQNKEITSVVPRGTKLQHFWIKDGVAYVDFNNKLLATGGGSTSEILLVGAIVNTLTEFPNVQKVQILVDGKKIDTLSGHLDIGEPLSRSEKMIRK